MHDVEQKYIDHYVEQICSDRLFSCYISVFNMTGVEKPYLNIGVILYSHIDTESGWYYLHPTYHTI